MSALIAMLKPLADARRFEVLHALGIHARPRGTGYIRISDPMSRDRDPSLVIWTHGGRLTFRRYGSDAAGDIIDLVAYLHGWPRGSREAVRWLADFVGLERLTPAQRRLAAARAHKLIEQEQHHHDEKLSLARADAFGLWRAATPIEGSLGEVYLRSRGIVLRDLPDGVRGGARTPSALRFLPAHRHVESGRTLPCLIAACVDFACFAARPPRAAKPMIQAVHRTWLKPDGSGKADVAPVKKVWPSYAGLVIPLWRGASNLSVRDAIASGLRETLVLTEGIEDGLSAVVANPEHRVWAAISLNNLANVPIPECIDGIIVHRQRDWHNLQAVAAFEAAIGKLEATGRPVAIVEALAGKDLNDTLRGE
ncbi:MAG TPA: toprim domain-containing protein [Burkholderiaceae bacterium]|nr:toprim domain-containing protein [Burkholderiaceae bacterium]